MAVAHDAGSESAVSTSAASFSWTHTPTGTPRAAVVFVVSIQSTGDDTDVSYGGVAMSPVSYTGADSDTEPGFIRAWFLDNVASGAQTVEVLRNNDATQMMGICSTVTAASACEVYEAGMRTEGGSSSNVGASTSGTGTASYTVPTVDDGSPGTNSQRYAAGYYGSAGPPTVGTGTTLVHNHDFTSFGWAVGRETTPGQGARNCGFTNTTADDHAAVYLAVRETPAPPATTGPGWYGTGVW